MEELKGDDLIVFSYAHCPFCCADIIFPDEENPETICEQCGTKFYAEFDEQGFLLKVYYCDFDYPFKASKEVI